MRKFKLFFLTLVALLSWASPTLAQDTWTVAGSSAALNGTTNWAETNAENDMVTGDGTNYSLTVTDCTLEGGTIYKFKVVKNHDWSEAYPGSDYAFTVSETAVYTVVYTFNTDSKEVNCETTKTGEAGAVVHTYTLVGETDLIGVYWDQTATQFDMTTTDDVNYSFVLQKKSLTAGDYEYKVAVDHAWGTSYPNENAILAITEDGVYDITFTFNAETHAVGALAVKRVPYTADFNTTINTSDHAFQVASNWRHIVDTYELSYSDNPGYASYSYSETAGVGGTGALSCNTNQSNYSIYDLLVTPVVKGTVTIAAKATASYYTPQLTFYKIIDNGDGTFTRGDQISVDVSAINTSDYTTITIPVDEAGERIGIRSSYVWLDNFSATEATIIPEEKITIASAVPSETTGLIKWEQQANGKVLVSYTVTVTNTGDVDLTQGTDGFSVSIFNRSTNEVYATIPVPQDLAKGETSEPFVVSAEVETSLWPNSYTYINMDLKENLFGSVVQRAQSTYVAYEPKFVFRVAESTSTSSITAAEAWGTITETTTKNYEIANTGTAPLTIKSITLPTGFTSDNAPTTQFVLAKGATQAINITQDATATGTFEGTLTIVYLDKDEAEQNYELAFSATVIGANTWTADFNNTTSKPLYPAGSIAEAGIYSDYQYNSTTKTYNNWLTGRTGNGYDTANNKFITPKLHANAGDKLAFDVKAGYSSTNAYFVKVYVSTDRKTWGDPVAYYTYTTDTEKGSEGVSSAFTTKTLSFDETGDYYVAFALYGTSGIDNLVGLEKVDVAHDLYIKSVTWPDASIKSGTSQSSRPNVDIIPLTDETAEAYTVKYVCGETVLAEGTPVALTASATSSTSFSFTWTPNVESTTVYENTKVVFDFGGGVVFETETFDLTVTNEAIFHFVKTLPSSKWYEPTDYTTPITFGKTNTADSQSFYVYNWGSAPLTVKSISVPAGFTVTPAEQFNVVAFNEADLNAASQAVEITFSATEAGNYSGDMVITYLDGANAEQTFNIAVSGTKLDPSKFYANFDDGGWPAGSVYQSNISSSNGGTYSAPNYYISSSSSTNNIFVTPKLTAAAGDKLLFDAKLYSTYWSEGAVKVYAAATRDEVLNAEEGTTRKQLFYVSGEDTEADATMTTSYQTFEVTVPTAGDYFFGFEISGRPYVDELYGLAPVAVAHDWKIASSNIPAEAMQNVAATATINVLNFGLAEEAADSYTVTAYVDGKAAGTGSAVAIPMNHKLTDAGTALSVNFMSPKVGTFPVCLEVKNGDYSVATDPINVTFAEEIFVSDAKQVGTKSSTGRDNGFVDWYNADGNTTKYTDILYPAAKISAAGIKAGDKISAISFKGTNSAKTIKAKVTSWVATSTGEVNLGTVDKDAMTEVSVYDATESAIEFPNDFESIITLPTPIVWDGTSDIRIYTETVGQGSGNWLSVQFPYDTEISMSYNGTTKYGPVAFFYLQEEAPTLAGTVTKSNGEGLEGATVTLVGENGAEYAGVTAADGSYNINVIQNNQTYTVTFAAAGYLSMNPTVDMAGTSQVFDWTLYNSFGIVGDAGLGLDWNEDIEMEQSTTDLNVFTLVLDNVAIKAGKFEYKLRADKEWNLNKKYELPYEGNQNWNFGTEMYPEGNYKLTFTADVFNHTLTLEPEFLTPTGIRNVNTNTVDGDIYTVGGVRSEKLVKGQMNIIRTSDGKVRKVYVK